jgi:glutamate dehydrogenase/leucine dehydrogenase
MMFCVFHGMTFKAAITGLNIGGKAVSYGDAKLKKRLMRKFGEFVHSFRKIYYC